MTREKARKELEARGWTRCDANEWYLLPPRGYVGHSGMVLRSKTFACMADVPLSFLTLDLINAVAGEKSSGGGND